MILLAHNCNAQNNYPQDGDNMLNNNIDKFIGTWKWEDNGQVFRIVLKKENVKLPVNMNLRGDVLYGWHEYTINGSVQESDMQYLNSPFINKKHSLFSMGSVDNPNHLKLAIKHLSKNKSVSGVVEYIDSTHIKIVKIEDYPGLKVNLPGKPPFDWSISLPQNIILTKQ